MRSLIPIVSYSPHGILFKSSQTPLAPEAITSLLGNVKNDDIPCRRNNVTRRRSFVLYPDFNRIGCLDMGGNGHVLNINSRTDNHRVANGGSQYGHGFGFTCSVIQRGGVVGERVKNKTL